MTEKELINSCLKGEESAWKEFFKRYNKYIYGTIRKYEFDSDNQKDIYQKIYLNLQEKALRYWRGDSKLTTYLCKVTYNECMDWIRGERGREKNIESIRDNYRTQENSTAEKKILDKERIEFLTVIIKNELNEEEQFIVIMIYFEGLKQKDIANLLDKREDEVARIKKKALEKMKKACKKRGIDPSNL